MKKRIISLALAMATCFALGITSFAVEPPTIHQTMMALSPGYDPLAWTNWTAPTVVRSSKTAQISAAVDLVDFVIDVIATASTGGLAAFVPTPTDQLWELAEEIMEDYTKCYYLSMIDEVYYTYTYRWRANDATMQMQIQTEVEIYANASRTILIDTYTETFTYIQNLNKSI